MCKNPCGMQSLCKNCLEIIKEVENRPKMKKKEVLHLRKHYSVYFKLYQRLDWELSSSLKWLNKSMRRELLVAYLEARNPDWNKAIYLSKEEAERRNKTYSKK